MWPAKEDVGSAVCTVHNHPTSANFVRTSAEHRGVLAASFILLVAQQNLLKLTTTWQTGGARPI